MFEPLLESMIREAVALALQDGAEIKVGEDGALQAGLSLELVGEPEPTGFWLSFTYNAPVIAAAQPPPAELSYLVVSIWIPADDLFGAAAADHDRLLRLLNQYNLEPGIKCRIDQDGDALAADAPIVVEADLAVAGIRSAQDIARTIERLADFVTDNLPDIRGRLALGAATRG